MTTQEQDHRLQLLNSLLTTPHRDLDKIYSSHKTIIDEDPIFYRQISAWYYDNGDIRDAKEVFIANLCMHDDTEFRNTGLALLRQLPPYQVYRTVKFIKSKRKNAPRSVATEVTNYLREREEDRDWFDSSVLNARKQLKNLYIMFHVKPSEYAQQVLFDDDPPSDSKLYSLKLLSRATTPMEQAEIIVKERIPYRLASSVVKSMTPVVIFALIDVMTTQELINNLNSLKKRGAFDNEDIKSVIEEKLAKAKTDKKVAALKGVKAIESGNFSEDIQDKILDVVDSQVKSKGRIKKPTAIFVDKSQSMSEGIKVGIDLASTISTSVDNSLYCYAFDTMPYKLENGTGFKHWENVFKHIKARGGTLPSVPFANMIKNKEYVEQIVLITDEGENYTNDFLNGLIRYEQAMNVKPNVFIVRCGHQRFRHTIITESLRKSGREVDDYDFDGDYYALPGLVKFLSRPSRLELLMEVMSYPLPKRKTSVVTSV